MEIVDEKTGVTSLTIEAQLKKTRRFRKSETLDEDLTPEAREKKKLEKKTKYKDLTIDDNVQWEWRDKDKISNNITNFSEFDERLKDKRPRRKK